ncbi:P-loop containing nucleoside triphosphate hydrolase protein [Rhexocercosporidium sp. MPI-PUGE-AT-0058]|nr:P-loop containing nucleoside triphosphate hydrolase protein [Rhexocercosporidium sp. MPI-PUGE-AT-0058]
MDDLLLANKASYLSQVAAWEGSLIPLANKGATTTLKETLSDSDTVIGARIRPLPEEDKELGHVPSVYAREKGTFADVHELRVRVRGPPVVTTSSFQVDRLYGPESTSDEIYDDLCGPLVPWAWSGGISTLFAYGQTGSGKTFTLDALERRAAKDLFGGLNGNRDIYVSVFDLAGNIASDLLNDRHRISVMQDSFGESQLVGALEPKVSSADELIELIERSMTFRKSAPTLRNDSSSRTHAVCRIRIVNKDVSETPDGLLFLIDLAGSEASTDTKEHSADRMKESREINTSLSTLKDCIRGRTMWYMEQAEVGVKSKPVHIPYRNSTITKVLKHVFDTKGHRHCKTAVVACVSPNIVDARPTKNTFRYAELLRIPVPPFRQPAHQEEMPSTWTPAALKAWVDNNSGSPPINSTLLAPTENGIQICRLPKGEFVSRCLKTPGVTEQQARAFYDKLWRLHIDSRKMMNNAKPKPAQPTTSRTQEAGDTSVAKSTTVPFQQHLRPGMFIERKNSSMYLSKFMIMCPVGSFTISSSSQSQAPGPEVSQPKSSVAPTGIELKDNRKFICALVLPSPMADAYELDVTRQFEIAVDEMEKEFLMEYDASSRCYYITL